MLPKGVKHVNMDSNIGYKKLRCVQQILDALKMDNRQVFPPKLQLQHCLGLITKKITFYYTISKNQ